MSDDHLTDSGPISSNTVKATHPGMMFWAGTGPRSTTCRECLFWKPNGYYARGGRHSGILKPGYCEEAAKHTRGAPKKTVPHSAMACKYFQENTKPPKVSA